MRGITKRFRNFAANFDEMHHRENIKQRVSESKAERVWALPNRWSSESHQACLNGRFASEVGVANVSCFDRRSNIVKREQKMTEFLGHSNNFATLSLSLSLSLSHICANRQSSFIRNRGRPRVNIRLFLHPCKKSRTIYAGVDSNNNIHL